MENTFIKNNSRKYNTDFRKKIINKIERINNKEYQIDIYNIIIQDIGNNFSSNRNGLFINLNLLSDNSISEIINYLENKFIYVKSNIDTDNNTDNDYNKDTNNDYNKNTDNDYNKNTNNYNYYNNEYDNDNDNDKYFYIANKQKNIKNKINKKISLDNYHKLSTEEKQIIKNINNFN